MVSCIVLTIECNDDFTSHMKTMNLQGSQRAESKKSAKSERALSQDTKQESVKKEEEDEKPEESIASRVRRRHGP